jgi:hypothetical protein
VLGRHAIATGGFPVSALARRRLLLGLRGSGRFATPGYAGTRRAGFRLDLRRRGISVSYVRHRVLR